MGLTLINNPIMVEGKQRGAEGRASRVYPTAHTILQHERVIGTLLIWLNLSQFCPIPLSTCSAPTHLCCNLLANPLRIPHILNSTPSHLCAPTSAQATSIPCSKHHGFPIGLPASALSPPIVHRAAGVIAEKRKLRSRFPSSDFSPYYAVLAIQSSAQLSRPHGL